MCGRYAASRGAEELVEELGIAVDSTGGRLRTTHNAAPTSQRAVVRAAPTGAGADAAPGGAAPGGAPVRELTLAGWGLVPFFAKDASSGARMINARSETVLDKPAYRRAVRRSRVLVPADGWYEWQRRTEGGRTTKVAHYMSPEGGGSLLLAGIAESWRPHGEDAEPVITFSILTKDAHGVLAQVHDRTPVLVPQDLHDDWLDHGLERREDVEALLAAVVASAPTGPADEASAVRGVSVVPVGRAVGNVRADGAELVVPTGPPLT